MFNDKTPESIHEAMLGAINDEIDKREGSVAYDLSYPAAIELGNVYMALDAVIELAFAETTYGVYLDMWTSAFGVTRKEALVARGSVTLSGPDGTVVPIGTRLQTSNDLFFETTTAATIASGTAQVEAQSSEPGVLGNVAVNEVNALAPGDLYGVVSITSSTQFNGGLDAETDEDLRARFLERAKNPSTSGNAQHYREWAMSVAGVGDAAVYPLHAGPGTVKVVVVNAAKQPPATDIVDRARAYVEANKPIGSTLTVAGATALNINVTATIVIEPGYELPAIQTTFNEQLTEYLRSIAFTGEDVRYTRIGQALSSTEGVRDYEDLRVNGGVVNIVPTNEQVAVRGTVTLSV